MPDRNHLNLSRIQPSENNQMNKTGAFSFYSSAVALSRRAISSVSFLFLALTKCGMNVTSYLEWLHQALPLMDFILLQHVLED